MTTYKTIHTCVICLKYISMILLVTTYPDLSFERELLENSALTSLILDLALNSNLCIFN
jgi:hypothetical protein